VNASSKRPLGGQFFPFRELFHRATWGAAAAVLEMHRNALFCYNQAKCCCQSDKMRNAEHVSFARLPIINHVLAAARDGSFNCRKIEIPSNMALLKFDGAGGVRIVFLCAAVMIVGIPIYPHESENDIRAAYAAQNARAIEFASGMNVGISRRGIRALPDRALPGYVSDASGSFLHLFAYRTVLFVIENDSVNYVIGEFYRTRCMIRWSILGEEDRELRDIEQHSLQLATPLPPIWALLRLTWHKMHP
jgi:hypothetical protein